MWNKLVSDLLVSILYMEFDIFSIIWNSPILRWSNFFYLVCYHFLYIPCLLRYTLAVFCFCHIIFYCMHVNLLTFLRLVFHLRSNHFYISFFSSYSGILLVSVAFDKYSSAKSVTESSVSLYLLMHSAAIFVQILFIIFFVDPTYHFIY